MSIDNELKCMNYGLAGLFIGIIVGIFSSGAEVPAPKTYSKPKERFEDKNITVPVYSSVIPDCIIGYRTVHYTTFRLNGNLRHKLECYYRGYNHEVLSDTKDEAISAMSTLLSA